MMAYSLSWQKAIKLFGFHQQVDTSFDYARAFLSLPNEDYKGLLVYLILQCLTCCFYEVLRRILWIRLNLSN